MTNCVEFHQHECSFIHNINPDPNTNKPPPQWEGNFLGGLRVPCLTFPHQKLWQLTLWSLATTGITDSDQRHVISLYQRTSWRQEWHLHQYNPELIISVGRDTAAAYRGVGGTTTATTGWWLRANETRSNWTRSIFSVPMRRVSVGRVPMRRVPNRRGYIVMADTFTWFIKYCCIIDVFMRNEICAFWKSVFLGRLGPKYAHIWRFVSRLKATEMRIFIWREWQLISWYACVFVKKLSYVLHQKALFWGN